MKGAVLAAITGWEEERRRALSLLRVQIKQAARRHDTAAEWALLTALTDVKAALRERAAHLCSLTLAPRNLAAPHEWAAGAQATATAMPLQPQAPAPLPVAEATELPADLGWAQWLQAVDMHVHA